MIARRALLTGLASLIAAPAIVRAGSLMPVKTALIPDLWFYQDMLREAAKLFERSNAMLREIDREYEADRAFVTGEQWTKADLERLSGHQYGNLRGVDGFKIGDVVQIRLPADFTITDRPTLSLQEDPVTMTIRRIPFPHETVDLPQIPDSLTLAAAAVAVAPVVLAKPVTRRFWVR